MLSLEEVARIARLARITVAGEEAVRLRGQLNDILSLIDQMRAVDTEGVEPMSHPQPLAQRLRADEVREGDRRQDFQSIAPQVQDGLYLVPRVVE
jgi:aspartyl-tRNA(Asn)/glutamyl-tRNA(Gln) amidotransferase subunit C